MKIIGLMLARNEDWVIGLSARAALMWCDALVVMLHRCEDETHETLCQIADGHLETDLSEARMWVMADDHESWEEMRLRQEMLKAARWMGATHIALIDADEVLSANLLPTIRGHVENIPPGQILQLPWLQFSGACPHGVGKASLCASCCRFDYPAFVMTSGMWATQNVCAAFPDQPEFHWSARDGYDFHHRHPMGAKYDPWECPELANPKRGQSMLRSGGLMHLQFLSRRRLIAKQFLYQLTERLRWPDRDPISVMVNRYAPTVHESDSAKLSPVPESWWKDYSHLMQYLHIDREPWQERECQRIIEENPGIAVGLEDFGLTNCQSSGYWGQWGRVAK